MVNRKRNIQIKFYVTEEEQQKINEKMVQVRASQIGTFFRDVAIGENSDKREQIYGHGLDEQLLSVENKIIRLTELAANGMPVQSDMAEIQNEIHRIRTLFLFDAR